MSIWSNCHQWWSVSIQCNEKAAGAARNCLCPQSWFLTSNRCLWTSFSPNAKTDVVPNAVSRASVSIPVIAVVADIAKLIRLQLRLWWWVVRITCSDSDLAVCSAARTSASVRVRRARARSRSTPSPRRTGMTSRLLLPSRCVYLCSLAENFHARHPKVFRTLDLHAWPMFRCATSAKLW